MKVAKLLQTGAELLKIMSIYDLKVGDWRYVELYSKFEKARKDGVKYDVIIMQLAETYGISESSVKRLIRKMSKEF